MKRMTRQRQAILDCFKKCSRPLSVEEILQDAAEAVPQLNLATVYRNLKLLVDEGIISPVDLPGGNPRYECVGLKHHHHFLCEKCNRLFDVHGCPEGISGMVPQGFKLLGHTITLSGMCADCLQT